MPGGNKNPSRLEVVETFSWQRLLNDAIGRIQQRSVCQTEDDVSNDLDLRSRSFQSFANLSKSNTV